jgi:hypothetical protein
MNEGTGSSYIYEDSATMPAGRFMRCKGLVLYWRSNQCNSFPQTILKD